MSYANEDPNLRVDGCPPAAKALITRLQSQTESYNYCRSSHPSVRRDALMTMQKTRYNLEVYISRLAKAAAKRDGART